MLIFSVLTEPQKHQQLINGRSAKVSGLLNQEVWEHRSGKAVTLQVRIAALETQIAISILRLASVDIRVSQGPCSIPPPVSEVLKNWYPRRMSHAESKLQIYWRFRKTSLVVKYFTSVRLPQCQNIVGGRQRENSAVEVPQSITAAVGKPTVVSHGDYTSSGAGLQ